MAKDSFEQATGMIESFPMDLITRRLELLKDSVFRFQSMLKGRHRSGLGDTESIMMLEIINKDVASLRDITGEIVDEANKVIGRVGGKQASVAKDVLTLARKVISEENALNGLKNAQARKFVSKIIFPYTRGFWKDDSWRGVHDIWKVLDDAGVDWHLVDSFYGHDEKGMPNSKTWKFEVEFKNDRGRPTTLHGICVASGAGPIGDPLSRYDIVCYVS